MFNAQCSRVAFMVRRGGYCIPPMARRESRFPIAIGSHSCLPALLSISLTRGYLRSCGPILWTVKDSHGNISTCSTVITVVATSNPVCAPPPFAEKGANPKFTETEVPGLSITPWPNPSVNYFNLKVTSQAKENVVIKMYDMAGKLVQVKSGAAGNNYIIGENAGPGLYFIEVSQGDKTARAKVVKQ